MTASSSSSSSSAAAAESQPPAKTPLTKHREESIKREIAKKEFWDVIFDKFGKFNEECNKQWKGPDSADFEFERSVIREHVEIIEHGVLMSLVVFGTLRLTAHPKFTPFAENYIKPFFRLTPPPAKPKKAFQSTHLKNNNYQSKVDDVISSKPPTVAARHAGGGRHFKSYLEKQRDVHVDRIEKAAEAPHDFMVATLVGLSATLFFLRPHQIRLDFEEAPLSPGRSIFSEQMCDDFVKIYRHVDPNVFNFEGLDKPDSNLASFESFSRNCALRLDQIQKRKDAGVDKPLVLPTNGPWEPTNDSAHSNEKSYTD